MDEYIENEQTGMTQYEKDCQDEEFQRIMEEHQKPFIVKPDNTVFYTSPEVEEQEHKYTLTISSINNDFVIKDLSMNGNNFVSEDKVDTSDWPGIFSLTIKDENRNIIEDYQYAKLIQQVQYEWDNNKYYLAFAEVPEQEVKNISMQANLEYLAMMSDIELE